MMQILALQTMLMLTDADKRKVGGRQKKKNTLTLDVVTVVDHNVLHEKILREIEERDITQTGDGGDSDDEGLEIDFHNNANAVRQRIKLGVPNDDLDNPSKGETDTDNLDIENIDNSVGEPWWHMRAPGAAIPGLPKGWSPQREPDNWRGYVPKINSGAPLEDNINNPGQWNLYSSHPNMRRKNIQKTLRIWSPGGYDF